jgi:hypothetical protein
MNLRTTKQQEAVKRWGAAGYTTAQNDVGFKIGRDRPKYGERVRRGCLVIMHGNTSGHDRVVTIYPDGTSTFSAPGSEATYSRRKLADALLTNGVIA